MQDVLGQAIYDYYYKNKPGKLWIHNRYGNKELMPIAAYFREEDDMPDMEWLALEKCTGRVLDIGSGAGSHSLVLQQNELSVTALDISPLATQAAMARGVKNALQGDIYTFDSQQYNTLLMLMNGIGLAGNMQQLHVLLQHLKKLLLPGGQILFDSSDIAYLYDGNLPVDGYYGEIWYKYEYKNETTDWFQWLYADQQTMQKAAQACDFDMEILYEDEYDQYLACLTLR